MGHRNRPTSTQPTYDMPNMTAVDSESRPYTDPKAKYPIAEQHRDARLQGALRRRPQR